MVAVSDQIEQLQRRLGYEFNDQALLHLALSHRSCGAHNNERLEFLGDSALNYVIGEYLYRNFENAPEGEMSRSRAALVRGETLARVAAELELGELIKLGPGERKSGARQRDSILANTLEAVVGAMLLDAGIERCRQVILQWFQRRLQELPLQGVAKDSKTLLQEFLQGRGRALPEYHLEQATGSDHRREFLVSCRLPELDLSLTGSANTRRKAEQEAALRVLQFLHE